MRTSEIAEDRYLLGRGSGLSVFVGYGKGYRVNAVIGIGNINVVTQYLGTVSEIPYVLYNAGSFALEVDILLFKNIIQVATGACVGEFGAERLWHRSGRWIVGLDCSTASGRTGGCGNR